MEKRWSDEAWEDYLWWQSQDKKMLTRVNKLIRDIERDPMAKPLGKGELLGGGVRSVRIDERNRLTYKVEDECLRILSCKGHYRDR